MAIVIWVILLLPVVSTSVPVDEPADEVITWKYFLTTLKSGIRSMIKYAMPTAIRGMSVANVSSECENSMLKFALAISKLESWAIKMIDANGKFQSGVLEGTVMDFGSLEECLRVKVHASGKTSGGKELFRGRYCMIGYSSPLMSPLKEKSPEGKNYTDLYGQPPEWVHDILVRGQGYMKNTAFWYGICLPSTCSEDDIRKMISILVKPMGLNVTVEDCQVDEPYVWPSYVTASVAVLSCLATICAVGTLLDIICRWRKDNPIDAEADNILQRVLKAFSLLTNTEKLFDTKDEEGSLNCFHGIRFLSATWIVLGHTYFYTDTWKYRKCRSLLTFYEGFNNHLPAAVLDNFTVPVGTFFFMSGFLLMYTTWRKLEKNNGKLNLLKFLVHKYLRMTPAIGLMFVLVFCLPLIDSGPVWNTTLNAPLRNSRKLWWANLLYINNFWDSREFCFLHTWFMAALMQFHIVGVLLLLVFYRWPVVGALLGSLIMVICSTKVASLVIRYNYPMPSMTIIKDMDVIEDYYTRIYIKPFTHFTSYTLGMALGYFILKCHKKKLAPKYQVLGWTLAVTGALFSVYGIYGPAEHVVVRALYIVGHRIGWALSVGWLIYACVTGIGGAVNRLLSWNAMHSLGQLSYLIYILHPLILIYQNASSRERVYCGNSGMVLLFLSTLVISLFMAYVGHIAVEMPFTILEKTVFRNGSNTKPESKEIQMISVQSVPNL